MSATSELTPDVTIIRQVIREKSKNKVQDKPVNNEEGDEKYEVIDSNVKVTEDTEDNVIVDPVVYMASPSHERQGTVHYLYWLPCIPYLQRY
jgi:hypothetical protein